MKTRTSWIAAWVEKSRPAAAGAAMCLSRLVVGVHYPSDVAAGAALGALTARVGASWMRRAGGHGHA